MADPGWFAWLSNLLQTKAWKTLSLAAGCFVLLRMDAAALISLSSVTRESLIVVGTLSTIMAATSLLRSIYDYFPLHTWLARKVARYRAARGLRDYIPFMTEHERRILAYLIAHNQKTFTAALDGGYAATLLARNIVILLARPGQQVNPEYVPMTVPDYLWEILVSNKEQFPYTPPQNGEVEAHPWRVHWMAR